MGFQESPLSVPDPRPSLIGRTRTKNSTEQKQNKTKISLPDLTNLIAGICFMRGVLEWAVEGIGEGEKGGCLPDTASL